MASRPDIGRLHVITDETLQTRFTHVELARLAAEGGADRVQYREKRPRTTRQSIEIASRIRESLAESRTGLVIDDRVDVAAAVDALGVHLGRDDLDPRLARRLLGEKTLIGATANNLDEARRAELAQVDYLGVGPVFGTHSKTSPAPTLGLERLAEIVRAVSIPVIAIGGITLDTLGSVLNTGAYGVAVISAIVCAADPRDGTRRFREALELEYASRPVAG